MAVQFNFILEDDEAETLMDAISHEIFQCTIRINHPGYKAERNWQIAHRDYLIQLQNKLHNTRVE